MSQPESVTGASTGAGCLTAATGSDLSTTRAMIGPCSLATTDATCARSSDTPTKPAPQGDRSYLNQQACWGSPVRPGTCFGSSSQITSQIQWNYPLVNKCHSALPGPDPRPVLYAEASVRANRLIPWPTGGWHERRGDTTDVVSILIHP